MRIPYEDLLRVAGYLATGDAEVGPIPPTPDQEMLLILRRLDRRMAELVASMQQRREAQKRKEDGRLPAGIRRDS